MSLGGVLTVHGISVRQGDAGAGSGGAIRVTGNGMVFLEDVFLTSNRANTRGAALEVVNDTGVADLQSVVISGNELTLIRPGIICASERASRPARAGC